MEGSSTGYETKASEDASSDHPLFFGINGVYEDSSSDIPFTYTEMHLRIKF